MSTDFNPKWKLKEQTEWTNKYQHIKLGKHTLNFSDVEGYITPKDQTIVFDQSMTLDVVYQEKPKHVLIVRTFKNEFSYNLSVKTNIQDSKWRIKGEEVWHDQSVVKELPMNTYVIEFSTVSGYFPLDDQVIYLSGNMQLVKEYSMPFLTVIINNLNGKWRFTGEIEWKSAGSYSVSLGTHVIEFSSVIDYVKPNNLSINIQNNTTVNGNYQVSKEDVGIGFNAVVYGNGIYVATKDASSSNSSYGDVYVSSDGKNWTKTHRFALATYPYSADANIAFGNGVFVWTGKTEDRHISATSEDGINWIERYTFTNLPAKFSNETTFCNGYFFHSLSNLGGIYYSSDGIQWNKSSIYQNISNVNYFNGKYYACIDGSTRYLCSNDLITWTPNSIVSTQITLFMLANNNGKLYASVRYGGTNISNYYSSTDGLNWTSIPSNFSYIECRRFIKTPNYWFMCCAPTAYGQKTPSLYKSSDLTNWTAVENISYTNYDFFPYGSTNFSLINNQLIVSDPLINKTLILRDV